MKKIIFLSLLSIFLYSCNEKGSDTASITEEIVSDPVIAGISKAIDVDPSNPKLYYDRALMQYEKGNYEAAIEDLEKSKQIDSSDFKTFHLLSDVYLDYFQSQKALNVMESAAEKFSKNIPTLLKLAELQLILKQYDASFFTIQKALNLDKQNPEVFFMMGVLYREQGDIERAINSFQTAVEIDPEIVDAWVILGDLFAEKDFEIASRYYDNAIRLAPENPQTYHAKAFYLQNQNKIQEAIYLYKRINSLDPQYTDAYLNTGILYLEQDSLAKALEHFDILVKIEPQGYLGYYYRGLTKMFAGEIEGARSDFNQSLVFNPDFEKAKQALDELNNSEQ